MIVSATANNQPCKIINSEWVAGQGSHTVRFPDGKEQQFKAQAVRVLKTEMNKEEPFKRSAE